MQATIYAPHEAESEKLAAVMAEMEQLGQPEIRAIWAGDCWIALEGSHRVAAAHELGLPVTIIEMDADDEISNHDFDDLPSTTTAIEIADYVGMTGPAYMVECE